MDEEGNIRKAVCYATKEEDFKTWFKFEDMMVTYPYWFIPNPSIFYNGKRFNPDIKKWMGKKEKKEKKESADTSPRDQSRDIQG